MKTRIISGLIMAPLLVLVWLGGYWLMAAAFIVGLMGIRELYNGFEAQGIKPSREIAYVAVCVLYVLNILWPENLWMNQHKWMLAVTKMTRITYSSHHCGWYHIRSEKLL